MNKENLTHQEILLQEERALAMQGFRLENEYQELRATLVKKYGEDGVKKVEEQIYGH